MPGVTPAALAIWRTPIAWKPALVRERDRGLDQPLADLGRALFLAGAAGSRLGFAAPSTPN